MSESQISFEGKSLVGIAGQAGVRCDLIMRASALALVRVERTVDDSLRKPGSISSMISRN